MRSTILGTVLAAATALALATPAHAATRSAVLVASCTATLTGTWSSPLDPGSTNAQHPETLRQSGSVTCVDNSGQPLVRGTMTRTANLPAAQCSGITYNDPSTNRIAWNDGTATTFTLNQATVISVLGAASTTGTGTATADSTKFSGDIVDGAVMSSGPGCGAASGQTNVASTVVFALAH